MKRLSPGSIGRRWRVAPAWRALLFRQLRLLLGSGILLADALRSLRDRFPHRPTRRILSRVHAEVAESRRRFSEALALFPRTFPPADLALVAAGEGAGSAELAERLGDLADRIEYEAAHRQQLGKACAYPAAVCVLTAALLVFLLSVVLPRLEDLLRSIGGEMPPLTRGVIAGSHWLQGALPPALALGVAAIAGFGPLRRWRAVARHSDAAFLRLPLAGTIYREFMVALFCKIYRSLYLSSQPAPVILESCLQLTGNEAVRAGLRTARIDVMQRGTRLSAALERTGLFPPLAILALEVGEQSGRLAEAMNDLSIHYQQQARSRLDTAIALLNPALTAAVVAAVGTLMIAFFQALYQVVYAVR